MWGMNTQMQEELWWGAGAALIVAAIAALADRRRANRKDIEAVGFMPWPLLLVLSLLAAAVLTAFAIKAR